MKIVFLTSRDLSGIDKFELAMTKGKWTHCVLLLDQDVNGDKLVIECTWQSGPRFNFWSNFQYRPYEIWEFDAGALDPILWGKSQYGGFYNYGMSLGLILKTFLGIERTDSILSWATSTLSKIGISYNPTNSGSWCSQFCAEFIEDTPSKLGVDMKWLDPESLYVSVGLSASFKKIAEQK